MVAIVSWWARDCYRFSGRLRMVTVISWCIVDGYSCFLVGLGWLLLFLGGLLMVLFISCSALVGCCCFLIGSRWLLNFLGGL